MNFRSETTRILVTKTECLNAKAKDYLVNIFSEYQFFVSLLFFREAFYLNKFFSKDRIFKFVKKALSGKVSLKRCSDKKTAAMMDLNF